VQSQWEAYKKLAGSMTPTLPASWTATVLLSPFGDPISPLRNWQQLVVGIIESSWTESESWLRARLYLTQDLKYVDFVFTAQKEDGLDEYQWYWIDSTPQHTVKGIYGPFPTTVRIPSPSFFEKSTWGNRYPLMCTDTHPQGIDCNHWTDSQGWYAFRRYDLFRILTVDSANPRRLPILGSFYIVNIPTFTRDEVSDSSKQLMQMIKKGPVHPADYWNPMLTQQDIHRAMARPLVCASCTPQDIQAVLPGFIARPDVQPPRWTDKVYIEGWALPDNDPVPYRTRVCYWWTGDADSKQQSVFIGPGEKGTYLGRTDTWLDARGTTVAFYNWESDRWEHKFSNLDNHLGPPRPDWVDRNGVMGQIVGNSDFGLASDEVLNLTATQEPEGGGKCPVFWAWFLANGVGMLFSEGSYLESKRNSLQLIDYYRFTRCAPLTEGDFSPPPPPTQPPGEPRAEAMYGQPIRRYSLRLPRITR
jgi:hypothetical protein